MRYVTLCLLIALLGACTPTQVPPPRTAEYYLSEGETMFDRGLYEEAIANWEKVRDSYYSPELNLIAEMKIAEAYFLSEKYPEAAAAYEDFLKQHPSDSRVPDALYHLGVSYYSQILSADRDQTATRNAKVTFEDLVKRFPQDPRNEEVKVYIDRCRDRLAAHEVEIGRFYLRTDHYDAAIGRLEGVFKSYPNYFNRDEAWFYLGQAYLKSGRKQQAMEAFNTLFSEFASSEYILQAQKLVEKYY